MIIEAAYSWKILKKTRLFIKFIYSIEDNRMGKYFECKLY